MTKPSLALAALLLVARAATADVPAGAPVQVEIGKQIPEFKADLIVLDGATEKMVPFDSRQANKVVAYIVVGTKCPSTGMYSERMAKLTEAYKSKGVEVIFVYPNREDDHDTKISFHRQKNLGGELIDDKDGRVARLLGALRTTEVFVADPQAKLVYHGAIDDNRDSPQKVTQHYAAAALDQTLAGQPVTTTSSRVNA